MVVEIFLVINIEGREEINDNQRDVIYRTFFYIDIHQKNYFSHFQQT